MDYDNSGFLLTAIVLWVFALADFIDIIQWSAVNAPVVELLRPAMHFLGYSIGGVFCLTASRFQWITAADTFAAARRVGILVFLPIVLSSLAVVFVSDPGSVYRLSSKLYLIVLISLVVWEIANQILERE